MRTLAAQKLMRWGYNPERRCLLTTVAKVLLVHTPGEPDAVFPSVDWRDKLHAMFAFLFRVFEKIFKILPIAGKDKQILESRLLEICLAGHLRDPQTHRAYRVQRTLFDGTNLSTYDKVCIFFLVPHVIGHQGTILPERQRFHLMSAIALAQKLIIAVRGNRSYSAPELQQIFVTDYIALFRHIESLHQVNSDVQHRKRMRKHMRNPQKYKAPTRFVPKDRAWDHQQTTSDTEDTDEAHATHGIKFFSQGDTALVHQHWIRQIVSAGSFDVHDTQGAEGSHKLSVHLTAARVRHLQPNKTQEHMMTFLCNHMVFDHIAPLDPPRPPPRPDHTIVNLPLRTYIAGVGRGPDVTMGRGLADVDTQGQLLHSEVRVAKVEVLDLVCKKFGLPKTRRSYETLGTHLEWTFGQRMITSCGITYYATDSQYLGFSDTTRRSRRVVLRMEGFEDVECTLPNGERDVLPTALCCQVVCFFKITGIEGFIAECNLEEVPGYLESDVQGDSMTLMLVRWFSPHPSCFERDELCRPVCPGPFRENHCLWQFTKTRRYRKSICNEHGRPNRNFIKQQHLFGGSDHKRQQCFENEKQAYYDVLSPLAIQSAVHMTCEFSEDTMNHSETWIETVTII